MYPTPIRERLCNVLAALIAKPGKRPNHVPVWTPSGCVARFHVCRGVQQGHGRCVERHPVTGQSPDLGRIHGAGAALFGYRGDEVSEIQQGVYKADIHHVSHPWRARAERGFPKILVREICRRVPCHQHRRNPNHEYPDVKQPCRITQRPRYPENRGKMRGNA